MFHSYLMVKVFATLFYLWIRREWVCHYSSLKRRRFINDIEVLDLIEKVC
jgi:hypothetical protein